MAILLIIFWASIYVIPGLIIIKLIDWVFDF